MNKKTNKYKQKYPRPSGVHAAGRTFYQRNGSGRGSAIGGQGDRRFFDKMTKDPDGKINNSDEALRFFKAASVYADKEGYDSLLYRLAEAIEHGAIKKCLEYVDADNNIGRQIFLQGFLPNCENT